MGRINLSSAFSGLTNGADAPKDRIVMMNPAELTPWRNPYTGEAQPFRVDETKLTDLEESVKSHGIINPILARRLDDRIEIVAGERRWKVANRLELTTVPVVIRTMSDEDAAILLVDTNLTARDEILPSEKAAAYKLRLDALRRQGKRTDLVEDEISHNSYAEVASEVGESARQVQRYVRLNYLVPELQAAVDEGKLPLNAAVELSYVPQEKQQEASGRIEDGESITIAAAKEHRRASSSKQTKDGHLSMPEDPAFRKQVASVFWNVLGDDAGYVYDSVQFASVIDSRCKSYHVSSCYEYRVSFSPKKISVSLNQGESYRVRPNEIRDLLLEYPDMNFHAIPMLTQVLNDLKRIGAENLLSSGAQAAIKLLRAETDHLISIHEQKER